MDQVELHPGLRGIYLDNTRSSFIDGTAGTLLYQGYNIHDLARESTFEEVTYLLWFGRLPTMAELRQFDVDLRTNRAIPPGVMAVIDLIKNGHPMDVLRTAVSALAAFDPDAGDNSFEASIRKGARLTAQFPAIVATHARLRQGKAPVAPDPLLNHAANFLYMLHGQKPDATSTRAVDLDLILHAEHGSNASSFAARVAASTLADLHAAVTAGLATLKGPLHGGAAEGVMALVHAIGSPENAEPYVKRLLAEGKHVMGFGHRVYKTEDPRARHLRDLARKMGEDRGLPAWYTILTRVEEAMAPLRQKGIHVNVDFYSGAVYYLLGIPEDLFVPIFAISRIAGWICQVLEQYANNNLIRPLLHYAGPVDLPYVPLKDR
ncbi:MAG: citrate (Si)-synthase [Armatimonadetes bacterium]|nr:citrate (Si)-synthase [Armatimonadota bacterium]